MKNRLSKTLLALALALAMALALLPALPTATADSTIPAPTFGVELKQNEQGWYYTEIVFDHYTHDTTITRLYYEYRSKPEGAPDSEYTEWVQGGYALNTNNHQDRTRRLYMEFDTTYQIRGYAADNKGNRLSGYSQSDMSSYPEYVVEYFEAIIGPEPGDNSIYFDYDFGEEWPVKIQAEYRKDNGAWTSLGSESFAGKFLHSHHVTDEGTYEYRIRAVTSGKFYGPWNYSNQVSFAKTNGWVEMYDGAWKYYQDGEPATGWIKDRGKWYHLDEDGYMETGWQKISSKWYYLGANGVMRTGWQKISSKWYYFNTSGVMQTGWQKIDSKWYYFNTSGVMQTGWQKIDSKWYYFNTSGVMQTDWQKIDGKWYYLGANGVMATGWQKISNKWYYFGTNGVMVANTSLTIKGKVYHFNSSGVCTNP